MSSSVPHKIAAYEEAVLVLFRHRWSIDRPFIVLTETKLNVVRVIAVGQLTVEPDQLVRRGES